MIHEHLVFSVAPDEGAYTVSVGALGVEIWLAHFKSKELAVGFINLFVDKLRKDAMHYASFDIKY